MDPYLEAHWRDVHASLVTATRNTLNEYLPEDLIARCEERIAIESEGEPDRFVLPDVRVLEAYNALASTSSNEGGVALAPYRLVALTEPIIERYIEIIESSGERLITVIEFVSPTNKIGKGLQTFVQKRDQLLGGGVSIVEIDLTRSGDWWGLLLPHQCPPKLVSTYRAVIRVPNDPGAAYLLPISLRTPLPPLKIPLRKEDAPIELELQPLLAQTYHTGRYARTIDYSRPPEPPLEPGSAAWADELLRTAGKRS